MYHWTHAFKHVGSRHRRRNNSRTRDASLYTFMYIAFDVICLICINYAFLSSPPGTNLCYFPQTLICRDLSNWSWHSFGPSYAHMECVTRLNYGQESAPNRPSEIPPFVCIYTMLLDMSMQGICIGPTSRDTGRRFASLPLLRWGTTHVQSWMRNGNDFWYVLNCKHVDILIPELKLSIATRLVEESHAYSVSMVRT